MNTKRIIQTIFVLGLLALVPAVVRAEAIPQLPHIFYGSATRNSDALPSGAVITARVDGVAVGSVTIQENGVYGGSGAYDQKLLVQGDITAGDQITFSTSGVNASQTASFASGEVQLLNLTFTVSGATIRGDSIESDGESDISIDSDTSGAAELPAGTSKLTLTNDTKLDLSSGMSSKSESDNLITIDGTSVDLSSFTSSSITTAVDLTKTQTIGDQNILVAKAVKLKSGTNGTAITLTNSSVSNASVEIPDDTTVMAPAGWGGSMQPPKAGSSAGTAPSGFTMGSTIVEMGDPSVTLLFDKPVKVVLSGVTGSVAYKPAGSSTWNTISDTCISATDSSNISFPGECSIQSGDDTIIWTYHFTSFGSLDAVPAPTPSPGGGGYSGSPVIIYAPISERIVINQGAEQTTSSTVTLTLSADRMITMYAPLEMRVSNQSNMLDSVWIAYATELSWTLAPGNGARTVYVQFRNKYGTGSVASDSIQATFSEESALDEASGQPTPQAPAPQVLGARVYADGTLIRASNKKIYAVVGDTLKHIASLEELRRSYSGIPILDVSDSVIASYGAAAGAKTYSSGTLIRASNKKIYAVIGSALKHIASLEELRASYSGKPIIDVADSVIASYGVVVGVKTYSPGELIRGSNKKIYVITPNGRKQHISSLEELARDHSRKPIHDVADNIIAQY